MGWNDIFQKMKKHYQLNNVKSYNDKYNKYYSKLTTHKELKKNIEEKVFEHMSNNLSVSIKEYEELLARRNVRVIQIKP